MDGVSIFDFHEEIELLKLLFNSSARDMVTPKLERLNEIFLIGEKSWEKNLERLRTKEVRYIVFSESAPWIKSGPIRHFYHTFDGDLGRKVWKAFFGSSKLGDIELGLQRLADRGFLMVDSLPFAMKYTTQIRKNPMYGELIKKWSPFLLGKLNDPRIRWAKDVKVAFAFRLNGKKIMEAFPDGIRLPKNRLLPLDDCKIAADQSGYPNLEKIRKIFELKDS